MRQKVVFENIVGADYAVVARSTLVRVRVMTEQAKGVAGSRFYLPRIDFSVFSMSFA